MTKIDIILPYFNGSKYIKEQLDSILNSDLEEIDLTVILINDASAIEETEYIKSILPAKVKYVENENNLGVIRTVEKGLALTSSEYVMLCDQDDVWLKSKIKNTLNFFKKVEDGCPCLVYTDLMIVDEQLNILHTSMHQYYRHNHKKIKPSLIFHNIVTGCTVMINRKLLDLVLPFPSQVTMHDHWLALCATFGGKVASLEESTILYRQHGMNQVGTPNKNIFSKLLNYRVTFPKFKHHLRLKTLMVEELAQRISKRGNEKEAFFLQKIVNAIKQRDILYLIKTKTISGSLTRILGTSGLLATLSKNEN